MPPKHDKTKKGTLKPKKKIIKKPKSEIKPQPFYYENTFYDILNISQEKQLKPESLELLVNNAKITEELKKEIIDTLSNPEKRKEYNKKLLNSMKEQGADVCINLPFNLQKPGAIIKKHYFYKPRDSGDPRGKGICAEFATRKIKGADNTTFYKAVKSKKYGKIWKKEIMFNSNKKRKEIEARNKKNILVDYEPFYFYKNNDSLINGKPLLRKKIVNEFEQKFPDDNLENYEKTKLFSESNIKKIVEHEIKHIKFYYVSHGNFIKKRKEKKLIIPCLTLVFLKNETGVANKKLFPKILKKEGIKIPGFTIDKYQIYASLRKKKGNKCEENKEMEY